MADDPSAPPMRGLIGWGLVRRLCGGVLRLPTATGCQLGKIDGIEQQVPGALFFLSADTNLQFYCIAGLCQHKLPVSAICQNCKHYMP